MKQVAKLVMIDNEGKYLLMYRSDHPVFGKDPDLPGGTVEDGESLRDAMAREVEEEAGISIDAMAAEEVYSGAKYSEHGTYKSLFVLRLEHRPEVVMS